MQINYRWSDVRDSRCFWSDSMGIWLWLPSPDLVPAIFCKICVGTAYASLQEPLPEDKFISFFLLQYRDYITLWRHPDSKYMYTLYLLDLSWSLCDLLSWGNKKLSMLEMPQMSLWTYLNLSDCVIFDKTWNASSFLILQCSKLQFGVIIEQSLSSAK